MCMPFASKLSRQPSAGCTGLSKPLQELLVTAVRAVTGKASLHSLYESYAESDSSAAAPAFKDLCGGQPMESLHANHISNSKFCIPRGIDRQHKPAAEYWQPLERLNKPPQTPPSQVFLLGGHRGHVHSPSLHLLSLIVNEIQEKQELNENVCSSITVLSSKYKLLAKARATRFGAALRHVRDPIQTVFVPIR